MKKLIFLALLTACGTDENPSETLEQLPDFSGWQMMRGSNDSCLEVNSENMSCTTDFQGGLENCSDATFKFFAKKDGYLHVLTVEKVFIRQGEPLKVEFEGKPEIFNIQDKFLDEQYHLFQCYGPNGEVTRI